MNALIVILLLVISFCHACLLVRVANALTARLATKCDLDAAEKRIIEAIDAGDEQALKALRDSLAAHVEPLKKAVEDANKISE